MSKLLAHIPNSPFRTLFMQKNHQTRYAPLRGNRGIRFGGVLGEQSAPMCTGKPTRRVTQ